MAGARWHPDSTSDGQVHLRDILDGIGQGRALRADLAVGRLYVRDLDGWIALRVNEHGACCWHRRVRRPRVRRLVEDGLAAGGESVELGSTADIWPSRYNPVPEGVVGGSV